MSASHIDLFKNFCILHFVTAKAAENACQRIMGAKFKPVAVPKKKQAKLKFAAKEKKTVSLLLTWCPIEPWFAHYVNVLKP